MLFVDVDNLLKNYLSSARAMELDRSMWYYIAGGAGKILR